ncbi:hypothetical protein [Spirilliplanes yamanashiensis]|uniref:Uncharacterized protein n=1 Tax=Spirilliplanes yamanashiensis TaxID=42233 RepID=A0A8J4DLS4_9ACTN|nr:hypothetical protein [Spirilliplanes yamanashiensis]MDP9818945.1 hypothetical protein [Spirilliplanes yamanashiensis]GIJ05400.1 hypothetical protein Sya03_47520 [Spirilliplanes yamanashiensis]
MIPQSWPLFATLPSPADDDEVWAVIGWEQPDRPGQTMRAYLVALGAGEAAGEQRIAFPAAVWPSAQAARESGPGPGDGALPAGNGPRH